jgi:hypothetical protein
VLSRTRGGIVVVEIGHPFVLSSLTLDWPNVVVRPKGRCVRAAGVLAVERYGLRLAHAKVSGAGPGHVEPGSLEGASSVGTRPKCRRAPGDLCAISLPVCNWRS